MVELNLGDKESGQTVPRVSAWKVITVIVTVAAALWGWYAVPASSAVATDYTKLRDRVTTLEVQRESDKAERDRQREADQKWRDRVDEKLDRLVEGLARMPR